MRQRLRLHLPGIGTWPAILMLVALAGGCGGKEPVCEDLEGLTCAEAGMPAEHYAAVCDACGTAWSCATVVREAGTVYRQQWRGCECIDENGCLLTTNYEKGGCGGSHGTDDPPDTGPPPEGTCDSD